MIPGEALIKVSDDYADACQALDEAQEYHDQNWKFMGDGPRAAAMAALATARFAKVSAGAIVLMVAHEAVSR